MDGMSKDALSEMIQSLRLIREELGRLPSRPDFLRRSGLTTEQIFSATGGGYQRLVELSGLRYSAGKKSKQEIRQQAHELLMKEVAARSVIIPPKLIHRLLCISDMHKPYGHPDTAAFLFALDDKYHFDHVLIGGDEIDHHAMSFHDHDPDLPNPGYELELAIKDLEPLFKRFPNADVLESNHGSLVYRKGKHHGFPRQVLKSYAEILRAPAGWTWREEFSYQFSNGHRAVAHHGYSANTLLASQKRASSLIQFHFHNSLSVQYWQNRDGLHFALQCGCLIDDTSLAMEYNKLTVNRPIGGCAGVFEGIPRLFPMPLNSKNRWNGIVP